MIEPKPLTKELREELNALLAGALADGESVVWTDALRDLIAAEAFWRETVKNATHSVDHEYPGNPSQCMFCQAIGHNEDIGHDADCPWLLAQEEK